MGWRWGITAGAMAGYFFEKTLQYPLVVLLSIFLPIALWLSAQEGKRLGALVLAAIFVADVMLLLFLLMYEPKPIPSPVRTEVAP